MTLARLAGEVLIAGCAAFVAGSAVGVAWGQPRPLMLAGGVARESTAYVGNLVLVGVIVAGDRSFAMFRDGAAGAGASEMVRVGGSVAGHRLVDIQVDRVTVETPGGERVTVRLAAAGSGEIHVPSRASETPDVVTATPLSRRNERRRERARVSSERAAAGLPVDPAADVME